MNLVHKSLLLNNPQKLWWNGLHVFNIWWVTNNNGYVACQNMGLKPTKMVICQIGIWMMDFYCGVHLEVVGAVIEPACC